MSFKSLITSLKSLAPGGISRHDHGLDSITRNPNQSTKNATAGTAQVSATALATSVHEQQNSESEDTIVRMADEVLNVPRNGRGPSRCKWLDMKIKKLGRKLQIVYPKGRRYPQENGSDFTRAIGYVVKTHALLNGVNYWKDIPDNLKVVYIKRLDSWFEIADVTTSCVRKIIMDKFANHYGQWRNTLHGIYKKRLQAGEEPREKIPRPEVKIEVWHELCDWFENEKFKKQSVANTKNRALLPYGHTCGFMTLIERYVCMGKMKERLDQSQQSMEDGTEENLEDEIMGGTLGKRPGYVTGMGYGVEAPKSCPAEVCSDRELELRKQHEQAESGLQCAHSKIESLIQTHEEKMEAAKVQMQQQMREEMRKMFMEFMSAGGNISNFTFPG